MRTLKMVVCGVGGQGVLTLARMIGEAALLAGLDVLVSEVHGMAQRGGSVVVHVKVGDQVYAPLIGEGDADVLVSMELLEALRNLRLLRRGGLMLVNDRLIPPNVPGAKYPSRLQVLEELRRLDAKVYVVDAYGLASRAGSYRAANTVMFGCLIGLSALPVSLEVAESTIKTLFSKRLAEVNVKALHIGFEEGKRLTVST